MADYTLTLTLSSDDPRAVKILKEIITDPGAQVGYHADELGVTITGSTLTANDD